LDGGQRAEQRSNAILSDAIECNPESKISDNGFRELLQSCGPDVFILLLLVPGLPEFLPGICLFPCRW
jgi:hypothetical protein